MQRIRVIDTHTGGEPTRVVISSPLDFRDVDMAARRRQFDREYADYRRAIACEPRGSDWLVGALLTPPVEPTSIAGVIFFNNVGTLGMCGHGLIGVAAALLYLESLPVGTHRIDTPVGTVEFTCQPNRSVSLRNVPSYRWRADVPLQLTTGQTVHGDIAWGGNWFFICHDHGLSVVPDQLRPLTQMSQDIRAGLKLAGITGQAGEEIDHVELIGPPSSSTVADARNFVLCPGGAYDRSPCGTGTSAKLACLAARGEWSEGELYRQESIVGSVFSASYRRLEGERVEPTISGTAYVTGEAELLLDPLDPFCMGIPL